MIRLIPTAILVVGLISMLAVGCGSDKVNIAEQAGLDGTTGITLSDGATSDILLIITDDQVIGGLVNALDTSLEPESEKLECIPDYEITFKLANGTLLALDYSCGSASFIRGAQEFLGGRDYNPPESFDELVGQQIAAVEAKSVNIARQAGLDGTVSVNIRQFSPDESDSDTDPYVSRGAITDPVAVSWIVASLDTTLRVAPKLMCIPEYELEFELEDGTTQTFGYSCEDASFLRGNQEFMGGEDFSPPAELDGLIIELAAVNR